MICLPASVSRANRCLNHSLSSAKCCFVQSHQLLVDSAMLFGSLYWLAMRSRASPPPCGAACSGGVSAGTWGISGGGAAGGACPVCPTAILSSASAIIVGYLDLGQPDQCVLSLHPRQLYPMPFSIRCLWPFSSLVEARWSLVS